jgi:hypothetical protein
VPGHLRLCVGQLLDVDRNWNAGLSDDDHLSEAISWLQRAQDATSDGGMSGRFRLIDGWTSSYPETTGYIIPTWLKLAEIEKDQAFVDRAERCVRFVLASQLDSGAFPSGEIAENCIAPSPFNSAQIIHGLLAWHLHVGDQRAMDAALRAADWLVSMQDEDGAFRRYSYRGVPASYTAHASCWLAELGVHTGRKSYLCAATRHLDWVLRHFVAEDSWFDLCGFDVKEHSSSLGTTHTIAYTIFGVLYMSQLLGRKDGIEAARSAALAALRCAESEGRVPGVMNSKWRPAADYTCLTGNAQLALIWFRLFELDDDLRYVNAAIGALDEVKRAQVMHLKHPGLRGGIAGSAPIWGDYLHFALPNWAAKFFIDALLLKKQIMSNLQVRDGAA